MVGLVFMIALQRTTKLLSRDPPHLLDDPGVRLYDSPTCVVG